VHFSLKNLRIWAALASSILVLVCINLPIALGGKKKPPAQFLISQKFIFSVGRCPLVTSPAYGVESVKMQQSGRQSVHRKLLDMTSNTSDCF